MVARETTRCSKPENAKTTRSSRGPPQSTTSYLPTHYKSGLHILQLLSMEALLGGSLVVSIHGSLEASFQPLGCFIVLNEFRLVLFLVSGGDRCHRPPFRTDSYQMRSKITRCHRPAEQCLAIAKAPQQARVVEQPPSLRLPAMPASTCRHQ